MRGVDWEDRGPYIAGPRVACTTLSGTSPLVGLEPAAMDPHGSVSVCRLRLLGGRRNTIHSSQDKVRHRLR